MKDSIDVPGSCFGGIWSEVQRDGVGDIDLVNVPQSTSQLQVLENPADYRRIQVTNELLLLF